MKTNKHEKFIKFIPSLISIIIGIVLGWYILFLNNPADSFAGIKTILLGGFNEGISGIGSVLYAATPVILTGLSVGFGMKTGLFNIGASGQFTIGAFTAILIGIKCTFLPFGLQTVIAILGGTLAGMLLGAFTGLLKAYFKVSEVISGIMLNYIAMLLTNFLIKKYIYEETLNRSAAVAKTAVIKSGVLDFILPGSNVNIIFIFAVIIAIFVKIIIDKSTFGYSLKTTGRNSHAAQASGIHTKTNTALTLAISGALAGIGGALMFLCDFDDRIQVSETVLQQGFTGISVALLGLSDPIGIILAGLLIAYLTVGGTYLQLFAYTPDVVDMIIAVIIFCGALVIPIQLYIRAWIKKKNKTPEEGQV